MKTQTAQTEPERINLFQMTETQKAQLAKEQKFCMNTYQPVRPFSNLRPPLFGSQYELVPTINAKLQWARESMQADADQRIQDVLRRATPTLRREPDEILLLIEAEPRAFGIAHPSIITKDFCSEAVFSNPKVYDLLPENMQQDPDVAFSYVQAMRSTIRNNPHSVVPVIPLNPKCPLEKIATRVYECEVVRAVLEEAGKEIDTHNYTVADKNLSPSATLMATCRHLFPDKAAEFDAIDRSVPEKFKKEIFAEALPQPSKNIYSRNLQDLLEAHATEEYRTELQNKQWENQCTRTISMCHILPSAASIEWIVANAPKEVTERYFDLNKKELRPEHPAMQEAAKRAWELQQAVTQGYAPNKQGEFSYHNKDILDMLATGPASVIKDNFQFEQYMQAAARRAESLEAGELVYIPIPATKEITDLKQYEKALKEEQIEAQAFAARLQAYPEYAQIYAEELSRCRDAREGLAPEEQELRKLQQEAYKHPVGNTELDKEVIAIMQKHNPDYYEQHLDAKGYLERRAAIVHQSVYSFAQQDEAQSLKNMLANCSEAYKIVAAKLDEMGARNPHSLLETPLARFAFDKTPQLHSPVYNAPRNDHNMTKGDMTKGEIDERSF